MNVKLKEGDKVHYSPSHGEKENGIIKSFGENEDAFVVYKCAGKWDNYKDYTGQNTKLSDLMYGWVNENEALLKEFCDHEYLPTNAKWKPINQRQCINCGDISD